MSDTVQFACPACGAGAECEDLAAAEALGCPCGWSVAPRVREPEVPGGPLPRCPLCGDPRLYVQKDFSRGVGIGLLAGGFLLAIALGALLGPWGFFATLGASVLLDALLFAVAGRVVICHWCETHLRGGSEDYPEFDLELHDVVRHQRSVAATGRAVPDHVGEAPAGDTASHPRRYDG